MLLNPRKDVTLKTDTSWKGRAAIACPIQIICEMCGARAYAQKRNRRFCVKCVKARIRQKALAKWHEKNKVNPKTYAIPDRVKLSDMIFHREGELGLKSHVETARACGLHSTHIDHLDLQEQASITQKTLTKLATGLQMTEQEIIDRGGLARRETHTKRGR